MHKTDMNPEGLDVGALIKRALPAVVSVEQACVIMARGLSDPGNGKVIHLHGLKEPVKLDGPTRTEIDKLILAGLQSTLQSLRLLMAMVEQVEQRIGTETATEHAQPKPPSEVRHSAVSDTPNA